ncbi:MAG: hypothetical protein WEA04_00160 [Candidatus Andersenbacteria bacterium]
MTFIEITLLAISCAITQYPALSCRELLMAPPVPRIAGIDKQGVVRANEETGPDRSLHEPVREGEAVDVVLSAEAALVWDVATGKELYAKEVDTRRPVASLSKLLSVLVIRDQLSAESMILIPPEAQAIQRSGAHIRLLPGEHASVQELLAAGLIASANDAMVSLAVAGFGSEENFVHYANQYALAQGLLNTKLANATGLSGGEQYSTAQDIRRLLTLVFADPLLQPLLSQKQGQLATQEGGRRTYKTTNQLLGTYLPIIAAKTGYTVEAGENLALFTSGPEGQRIGAVILGSEARFQDMKTLVEWIWRNYAWL